MEFTLKQLTPENGIAEYNMLQTLDRDEYGFTNPVNGMTFDEYKQWLVNQNDYSKALNLPENFIPQTTYFLYADTQPVGIARIRHYSSDFLEKQGVGNFGYGIAKSYRGKGYGNVLFNEVMKKCKDMGYTKIQSYVYRNNAASNQIFIKNGAKFLGIFQDIKNKYEVDLSNLKFLHF